jgi:hypothetical protein
MENTNQTQELEDKIYEELVEAIDNNKTMDDLKKSIGQTSLSWFLGNNRKREQARRKFFELRKVKREEKPVSQSK